MNHIKFQNFVKISIKTKRKHNTSPSINQNNIKYLPSQQQHVKVYNRNTGTRCKCAKLIINTPKQCHWGCSGVFSVNFKLLHTLFQCFHSWLWTSNYQLGEYRQFLQCSIVAYLINMHFHIAIISIWVYGTISNKHQKWGTVLIKGEVLRK